jgi:DNA-binding transcriptional MerR regulator
MKEKDEDEDGVELNEDGKYEAKINKLFWDITELAEMFDVNASLLRLWERQFDILKPKRINTRGDRKYTKKDIEDFKLIYNLVRERGYSIPGAQQKLKEMAKGDFNKAELLITLKKTRELLVNIRSRLK